ncbi:GerMN domain-containing protein [Actinoplanes awajinensis]|uniref:GerMN domain-containing protein n=1 Tax=Actinoplanes awajinensis subsp. mycoplanecinus TaxID=135947 RepID=A0A101J9T2_9ACTN|nr:GerMN domain-containing protein [Actinoplanes awajinensis]KUL22814.1 hypothetical protein ADL15_47350 [Actinoplanes awajinensis subsp. mycoplanecinus]
MTGARPIAVAVVALCLALTGCGVPAQDEPHEVALPRRPLTDASSTVVSADPVGQAAQVLCLVHEGRLAQSVRRADAALSPQGQLDALAAGPTEAEQAQGLSSALAGLSLVLATPPVAAAVTVEVTEADEGAARSDEILAYGQIVCTLTSRADVSSVAFTRGGQPLRVPRGDGTLTEQPLGAEDYQDLIGPP